MKNRKFRKLNVLKILLAVAFTGAIIFCFPFFEKVQAENTDAKVKTERETAIENALYTRAEFFGAQALVPFPTEKARGNLMGISQKYPNDAEIYRKLAKLDEKLEKFDTAEVELNNFVELQKDNLNALENLAAFYERRASFKKEAAVLERILAITPQNQRAAVFSRLVEFAQIHELGKYLAPDFYQKIAADNPAIFPIIEQLIDKLSTEKNYADALKILRGYKDGFPKRRNSLLKKEVDILLAMNNKAEAEQVYQTAFDPFWSDEETENYYSFLKEQDRFRTYGGELKEQFKGNNADFDTAIRLIKFRGRDGVSDNDSAAAVILQVEKARSAKNIAWQPEEIVTAARVLLADGESDTASRFLYTLHLQNALAPKSALRGKILYQLFELLSDSGEQRISLTRGDLRFYEDVGKSDLHPGITSGILSLIFSDTEPRQELATKETTATNFFNRAAAYRIFLAYKEEFPTSPELAQMYLDIVRLYTATNQTDIAAKTLAEFEGRYEKASDYPPVALKLADAFAAAEQPEKERKIYQQILDYLGKQGKSLAPKSAIIEGETDSDDPDAAPPVPKETPKLSNEGIEIPGEQKKDDNYYYDHYYENPNALRDYLGDDDNKVSYSDILKRLVEALSKDKKTDEILALYSNEIAKYPNEQGLYEERLTWLEQANLVDEQLKVYKTALDRFKTQDWQDKLARWFLRRDRKQDFAEFSQGLIDKLNDDDTQNYLAQFVDQNISGNDFDEQLYVKLYTTAHERFPHNINFVTGLLGFYESHKREKDWRNLSAEYYFESKSVRDIFVKNLAEKDELRNYLNQAREKCCADGNSMDNLPYALFRADAAAHLANFEEAVDTYTKLNELYPHTDEFQERLLNFKRSFGQRNRGSLAEAANIAYAQAEFTLSDAAYRTRSGELQAELGNYDIARNEWEKLIPAAPGDAETYLDTATVYWDYFQYNDALRTIKTLREKMNDDTLYAFQTAAILETQHKLPAAVGEYVKALGADEDENYSQTNGAKNQLIKIAGRREGKLQLINAAFQTERGRRVNDENLVLAYTNFLQEADQTEQAETILKKEISRSVNKEFLESAREFFSANDNQTGVQTALRQLGKTTANPRTAISYRLQLADSFLGEDRRVEAKKIVAELLAKFPTNYDVLSESADIYWRINSRDEAICVLQTGINRGKGKFQYIFSRKLAAKLVLQNRLDSAANILLKLHNEDGGDTAVFRELVNVYVTQNKAGALKKVFGETLSALKNQDTDRRELNAQVAEFRTQMIDAFTRLKDYPAAVEQHIEIINRRPEDEENIGNAINYVKRYGGGDVLLACYQKTAAEAYKNYRWNVILARIYEANNDLETAVKNYKTAIDNQPEMPELYLAVADIETRRTNYDAALENINKVLELTNDSPTYIKQKIAILDKAGRAEEAAAERARLPVRERPKQIVSDQVQQAQNQQTVEQIPAAVTYRETFDKLLEKPLAHDLTAAEVSSYVESVRTEENLDVIAGKLWTLRDKFVAEADGNNVINAAKARNQRQTLDGAMPEAVGKIAKATATSDVNATLQKDLSSRIDEVFKETDRNTTLSLIQNIAHQAGFGALEETILIRQKDKAFGNTDDFHPALRRLLNFYGERGMFQKIAEVLDAERSRDKYPANLDYPRLLAENARLIGDKDKELAALRESYQSATGKITTETNDLTARYLKSLYQNNRTELVNLTKKYSPYQLQLINFLLAKSERELAHEAISNAGQPQSWKLARNAETSLALREYSDKDECYFCDALRLAPIGEYIAQRPDKKNELVGDDWFRLVGEYGEWLYFAPNDEMKTDAQKFTPAMIENRPNSADEQARLGAFYLAQKDTKNAFEYLRVAVEMKPGDKNIKANLGAVYFQTGEPEKAREMWAGIIAGENTSIEDGELYLQTLREYGLAAEAREKLFSLVVKNLKENDPGKENYYDGKKPELPENFKNLIRQLAESLDSGAAQAAYLQKFTVAIPTSILLPQMIINESLIAEDNRALFYEMLIARHSISSSSDYNYEAVLEKTYNTETAEEIYDIENNYKHSQPEYERINWQKKYLDFLLARSENDEAQKLIADIESELNRHYSRPEWLRLARMKVQIRQGDLAKTQDAAKSFIGIEPKADVPTVKPPSIERLNDFLQILRDEQHDTEAGTLLQAFYARQLALEQYETANFIGLAQIYFERDDAENALQMLQLLNEAADENTKPEAFGKIAALPIIKLYEADRAKLEETKTVDSLNKNEALRRSAEICEQAVRIDEAITFRRNLLESAPDDANNKIELAKLYARDNQPETVRLLADVINNRNAETNSRWRAVWISREIVEDKADLLNAAVSADGELRNALEILVNDQIEIKVESPGSQFWFFIGLLAVEYRQNNYAMAAFQNSLIADNEAFNPFDEEDAVQQLIRLNITKNQPNAAIYLANANKAAKSDELLNLLSETAEKIGEFQRAIDFEKARSKDVDEDKIARLTNLDKEKLQKATDFAVDLKNVTQSSRLPS